MALLSQLSEVGAMTEEFFLSRLKSATSEANQHMLVVADKRTGHVVGAGTVVIEPKFIHEGGLVGHVEDVVVDSALRGKGIGKRLVQQLVLIANESGCYKVILDCAEENVPFYTICGFTRKEIMMVKYFEDVDQGSEEQAPVDGSAQTAPEMSEELGRELAEATIGDGLTVRPLRREDYSGEFIDLLAQLTVVGTISEEFFDRRVATIEQSLTSHMLVIDMTEMEVRDGVEVVTTRVVAAGTLLVEQKLIHRAGLAGHIEDVVVDCKVRGKGLGKRIILKLVALAKAAGCYKVILDCSESNAPFYRKCGFEAKEVQMVRYFQK
jgi:GNAT superfamily N-acetyltransferase